MCVRELVDIWMSQTRIIRIITAEISTTRVIICRSTCAIRSCDGRARSKREREGERKIGRARDTAADSHRPTNRVGSNIKRAARRFLAPMCLWNIKMMRPTRYVRYVRRYTRTSFMSHTRLCSFFFFFYSFHIFHILHGRFFFQLVRNINIKFHLENMLGMWFCANPYTLILVHVHWTKRKSIFSGWSIDYDCMWTRAGTLCWAVRVSSETYGM